VITVHRNLVEGQFIITIDNLVFEIKGVVHPKDRVIAYLRYVPTQNGYRKVYALDERETYLKHHHPLYLWFSEPYGRLVQSVPDDNIETILDPVDYLAALRNSASTASDLEQASLNLVDKMIEATGIEQLNIGITGSQLIGIAKKDSDIDLVVYGSDACQQFYSNLCKGIDSISGVHRYSGLLLDEHVSFRWGAHENLRPVFREIERKKVLQGLFENYHFFVRLVKAPDDLEYAYGDFSFQLKGRQFVSGKIVDDGDSIFTPCEYLVESDDLPDLRKLVSYRGRFTEQISKDAMFDAEGRLEMVTNHKEKSQYLQLVLGELPTDYLIPK
jgi:predicted nucleotidyltransferase